MNYTLNQIRNVLKQKGYRFFDSHKSYNLNIIGIRSTNKMANRFDDTLYLIYRDEALKMQLHCFDVTTDPGTKHLAHPMNALGTAILIPNQYMGAYRVGFHGHHPPRRIGYEALCQVKPVNVWRDNNKDNELNFSRGIVDTGIFGINIHRSNANFDAVQVNGWSAGCTVFKSPEDFDFFMIQCRKASSIYGNSFTYTLLTEADFESENEKSGLVFGASITAHTSLLASINDGKESISSLLRRLQQFLVQIGNTADISVIKAQLLPNIESLTKFLRYTTKALINDIQDRQEQIDNLHALLKLFEQLKIDNQQLKTENRILAKSLSKVQKNTILDNSSLLQNNKALLTEVAHLKAKMQTQTALVQSNSRLKSEIKALEQEIVRLVRDSL